MRPTFSTAAATKCPDLKALFFQSVATLVDNKPQIGTMKTVPRSETGSPVL
jgi:hypothetical protein